MLIPMRTGLAACVAAWLSGGILMAQVGNQGGAENPYAGSGTTVAFSSQTKQISLDDAIRMGIEHNLALIEARAQQKNVQAQALESLQPLLPSITAQAEQGAHQINLAAEGFSPRVIQEIEPLFPGIDFSNVSLIVRVDTTSAALTYSETLFNLSLIDQYRAAKESATSAYFKTQSARGLVVLNVATSYLEALATEARLNNAQALLRTDQLVLDQTVEQHRAGTAANLDELRARVQFQAQKQTVIAAEDNFEKAKIDLNREIGLPPEQPIQLTDASPYSELETMDIGEAKQQAYQNRQDYQGLKAQLRAAELERRAAKWERLPALDFGGDYGVTGVTHGLYHGTFAATGTLTLPIFQEAKFRGDREEATARLQEVTEQMANLREQIDQQLRDSMLDVQSTGELVRVARSNVDLAQEELEQARERFQAGVADNLPVVEAQSTLAGAEASLVDTTVQYNEAKLGLARNLGIIDSQYKTYLHGKTAP